MELFKNDLMNIDIFTFKSNGSSSKQIAQYFFPLLILLHTRRCFDVRWNTMAAGGGDIDCDRLSFGYCNAWRRRDRNTGLVCGEISALIDTDFD